MGSNDMELIDTCLLTLMGDLDDSTRVLWVNILRNQSKEDAWTS